MGSLYLYLSHTTWLKGIDAGAESANNGIHRAQRKANDWTLWRRLIDTATIRHGACQKKKNVMKYM